MTLSKGSGNKRQQASTPCESYEIESIAQNIILVSIAASRQVSSLAYDQHPGVQKGNLGFCLTHTFICWKEFTVSWVDVNRQLLFIIFIILICLLLHVIFTFMFIL